MCSFLQILRATQHLKHYTAVKALQLAVHNQWKTFIHLAKHSVHWADSKTNLERVLSDAACQNLYFLSVNPQATETFVTRIFFLQWLQILPILRKLKSRKGRNPVEDRPLYCHWLIKLITTLNTCEYKLLQKYK